MFLLEVDPDNVVVVSLTAEDCLFLAKALRGNSIRSHQLGQDYEELTSDTYAVAFRSLSLLCDFPPFNIIPSRTDVELYQDLKEKRIDERGRWSDVELRLVRSALDANH